MMHDGIKKKKKKKELYEEDPNTICLVYWQ